MQQLNHARFWHSLRKNKDAVVIEAFLREQVDKIPGNITALQNCYGYLQYQLAFPANKQIYELASRALDRFILKLRTSNNNLARLKRFDGSGLPLTTSCYAYSRGVSSWLVKNFPGSAILDHAEAAPAAISSILSLLLPQLEYENINQKELNLANRIKLLTGLEKPLQLNWLLQLFDDSSLPEKVKNELYDQLKIFVKWQLPGERYDKIFLKIRGQAVNYKLDSEKKQPAKIIISTISPSPGISYKEKKFLLHLMKFSLATRGRETDPVSDGDPASIRIFNMGSGLDIIVSALDKKQRLALENYLGFMICKNGIPISYGGGWIWGQRCKIGVNIFPEFRGAGSAHVFLQVLRLYYRVFGVRHFIVKPYQFGKENHEGLKSGAFWFYYKLGFRPLDPKTKKLARSEWKKMNSKNYYQSPLKTLRRFTVCPLELKLIPRPIPGFDAGELSVAVSNAINNNFHSSRKKALEAVFQKMKKRLPRGWTTTQRESMGLLIYFKKELTRQLEISNRTDFIKILQQTSR